MDSCRNCRYSTHMGSHNPALYCTRTKRTVAPEVSRCIEENQKIDAQLRTIAASCAEYQREE